jgi:transcriptional regulator with XRE-family HTH domain
VTDQRFGAVVRYLRIRRHLRQRDLAARAGVSQTLVSRLERGHLSETSLERIRRVGTALDLRVDVVGRWRGGELDRLLAAGHSALHESVAAHLRTLAAWRFASEVSFAHFGERGVIDILAWHEQSRALLVIELKTEFVDLNELLGTLDRKRRNAMQIARERGWIERAASVSAWVIVTDNSVNRHRARDHRAMLSTAYPGRGSADRTAPSAASASGASVVRGLVRRVPRPPRRPGSGSASAPRTIRGLNPRRSRLAGTRTRWSSRPRTERPGLALLARRRTGARA